MSAFGKKKKKKELQRSRHLQKKGKSGCFLSMSVVGITGK